MQSFMERFGISLSTSKTKYQDADDSGQRSNIDLLGPPNLQLGLSANQFEGGLIKKGHEIFIAAVVAVMLQAGLLAIATVTVYHQPTRRAISFKPKSYGYPCYMIGSVLLAIGIGLCSLAVERNTVEYDWKVLARKNDGNESAPRSIPVGRSKAKKSISPRLLWLQQTQEVNDQAFDGYAILAGPKRHIITSSRIEDTEKHLRRKQIENATVDKGDTSGDDSLKEKWATGAKDDVGDRMHPQIMNRLLMFKSAGCFRCLGTYHCRCRVRRWSRFHHTVHGASRPDIPLFDCTTRRNLPNGSCQGHHPEKTRTAASTLLCVRPLRS